MINTERLERQLTYNEYESAKSLYAELSEKHTAAKIAALLYKAGIDEGRRLEKARAERNAFHSGKKSYTKDELDNLLQAESDRRVNQALANYRAKLDAEATAETNDEPTSGDNEGSNE